MPCEEWNTNGPSTSSSNESKFGTFITRSVQDATSHIVSQCRVLGIKVDHSFSDGRGMIRITGANEKALDALTLPAKLLESGVNTAFVTLACVSVDFISKSGSPITLAAGVATPGSNWEPFQSVSNETIIVTTMNIESQKRRRDAYSTNSEYQLLVGSDADAATRSLADLYGNDNMDTTGIAKTFSPTFWVSN